MKATVTVVDTCPHGSDTRLSHQAVDTIDHLYQRMKTAGRDVTRTGDTITITSRGSGLCAHGERSCVGSSVETIRYEPQESLW